MGSPGSVMGDFVAFTQSGDAVGKRPGESRCQWRWRMGQDVGDGTFHPINQPWLASWFPWACQAATLSWQTRLGHWYLQTGDAD